MMVKIIKSLILHYDISVVISNQNERLYQKLSDLDISIITVNYFSKEPQCFYSLIHIFTNKKNEILSIFKDINPELIIFVQGDIELSSFGFLVAKKNNFKCVNYIPLLQSKRDIKSKLGFIRDLLNSLLFNKIDNLITISLYQRALGIKRGVLDYKIKIIDNYIERKSIIINKNKNNYKEITWVGRMVNKQKNIFLFIDLINEILKKNSHEFIFNIFGDGKDLIKAKKRLKFINEKNVKFHGWESDKEKIYKNTDVLILTSYFEGVPLVVLEALTLNIPVIAPMHELYDGLVPVKYQFSNLNDLYKKIFELKKNKDYFKFVDMNNVSIYFDEDRFDSQTIEVIDSFFG